MSDQRHRAGMRWPRLFLIGIGVLLASVVVLLAVSTTFDSFRAAREWVAHSEDARTRFGAVRRVIPLSFSGAFRERSQRANYDLLVFGDRRTGIVSVELARTEEGWKVTDSSY